MLLKTLELRKELRKIIKLFKSSFKNFSVQTAKQNGLLFLNKQSF